MCYHINQKSHRDCAPIWFDFEWISTSTIDSASDNTDVELTALKRVRCERAPNNTRKSLFLCCVLYEHIVNNNNNNEWAIAKRKQKTKSRRIIQWTFGPNWIWSRINGVCHEKFASNWLILLRFIIMITGIVVFSYIKKAGYFVHLNISSHTSMYANTMTVHTGLGLWWCLCVCVCRCVFAYKCIP